MPASAFISFGVGIVVLLLASHIMLQLIQVVAAKWKFSPLLVSMVLISFGTTLPELVVTISAVAKNDLGLAMGNIVGSSVLNITLIFGLAVLAGTVRIGNHKTQKNTFIMFLIAALLVLLRFSALPNLVQAGFLITALVGSLAYDYHLAINGRKKEDKRMLSKIIKTEKKHHRYPPLAFLLLFVAGISGLVAGGFLIVNAIETMAYFWQISTTVLGLTLIAIATSMPELITILMAEHEEEDKVVVGTLIGSNTFNMTVFPAIVLMAGSIKQYVPVVDMVFLLVSCLIFLFVIFHYRKQTIPHRVGLGLVIFFLIFAYMTMN